jgi:hypothetical protein
MIHIIQLLCPERHCLLATVYDPREKDGAAALAEMKAAVERAIERNIIEPECGLCRSRDWRYEDQPTIFKTLDEAIPVLLAQQRAQQISARIIKQQQARRN